MKYLFLGLFVILFACKKPSTERKKYTFNLHTKQDKELFSIQWCRNHYERDSFASYIKDTMAAPGEFLYMDITCLSCDDKDVIYLDVTNGNGATEHEFATGKFAHINHPVTVPLPE